MGWLSNLFKKENPTKTQHAETWNGYAPIFTQFGQDVYASDVVQQAVNCIVSEFKKLRPEHVREIGNDVSPVTDSTLQRVLERPNPLMTQSDFLEKCATILILNRNLFIVPVYYEWTDANNIQKRKYEALYPILPSQVDFIEDESNRLFVKFSFDNGAAFTVKYDSVIHVRTHYGVNEYMGGDAAGQPDNDALLQTLDLNHQLLQGVAAAMKATFAVNGIVKYNTMLDDGKTEAALKELESKLKKSESGFLPLDLKADFTPLKKEIQLVDETTLRFIDEKILRHFGVPLCMLTGDYTKAQYEAFYQKTLEGLVTAFSQAFTKALFTDREFGFGNRVKFYPKDLIFMSMDQTLQMITLLSNTGALFENEKRVALGLRPLAELEGKRYMSLNWVDVNIANQYQAGTAGGANSDDGGNSGNN